MADDPFKGMLEEMAAPRTRPAPVVHEDPFAKGLKRVLDEIAAPPQPAKGKAPVLHVMPGTLAEAPPIIVPGTLPAANPEYPRPGQGAGGNSQRLVIMDTELGLGQIENLKSPAPFIDEVDYYVQRKEQAAEAHRDEFYQRAQLQQEQRDELGREAIFARINPHTAVKAVLGNTVKVQSGQVGQNAPTVARWTGEDVEATSATIVLGILSPPPGNAAFNLRPFGIIEFGVVGALQTIEVDIGLGCQFTLSGAFINVALGMDDDGAGNTGSARLTGQIAFGNASSNGALTRTKYNTIGNGGNATVQVPSFGKNLLFYTDTPSQTYTLNFITWNGTTAYTFAVAANSFMTVPLPLAGDIEQVQIVPQTGSVNTRLVFQLVI